VTWRRRIREKIFNVKIEVVLNPFAIRGEAVLAKPRAQVLTDKK
jgi:hypothetical protein